MEVKIVTAAQLGGKDRVITLGKKDVKAGYAEGEYFCEDVRLGINDISAKLWAGPAQRTKDVRSNDKTKATRAVEENLKTAKEIARVANAAVRHYQTVLRLFKTGKTAKPTPSVRRMTK